MWREVFLAPQLQQHSTSSEGEAQSSLPAHGGCHNRAVEPETPLASLFKPSSQFLWPKGEDPVTLWPSSARAILFDPA